MKFWKIAPGGNAYFWDDCLERGIISINWMNEDDFTKYGSKKELTAALKKKKEGGSNAATSIWKFVHEVQPGHVVFANDGRSAVKGVGVVQSGYLPPDSKRNPNRKQDHHKQIRLVDWRIVQDVEFDYYIFNTPTVGLLDEAQCDELHRAFLKSNSRLKPILEDLFNSPVRLMPETGDVSEEPFIPSGNDRREFVRRSIAVRRGQQSFREKLCSRFGNRCAVTGCKLLDVLEAAHISPYRGEKDNDPSNGLLLRSDIHTLFDLNLLGVNPKSLKIELHPRVKNDGQYKQFNGKKIKVVDKQVPSNAALKNRYKEFLAAVHHT